MNPSAAIARNIRVQRAEKRISQIDFASRAGLSQSYASRLEAGGENPTLSTLAKAAHGLGITLSELMEERPDTPAKAA